MKTLEDAQDWLRENVDDGARCPCCTQFAKVYRRKINAGMARALVIMWSLNGTDWFYLPDITHKWQGRDESNLRHFGLIEEAGERRPDGTRKGWWHVTNLGASFVRGHTSIAKYARIYDGRCLGLDETETVTIHDALGDRFRLDELMGVS